MKLSLEKMENCEMCITATYSPDEVENSTQQIYLRERNKYRKIPGFRPGKAPRKVIEKYYSISFCDIALEELHMESLKKAEDEFSLETVSQPYPGDTKTLEDGSVQTELFLTVKPDVILGTYKGVEVKEITCEITDEDIEKKLNEMAEKNVRIVTVEDRNVVQNNDIIYIDFECIVDGKDIEDGRAEDRKIELGNGEFLPDFEKNLIGATLGEPFEFSITFPENYHESVAGKDALFKAKINSIKHKEYPELNDEFAQDISTFDTIAELKEDIRNKIKSEKESATKKQLEKNIVGAVADNAKVDIPEVMINTEVHESILRMEHEMSKAFGLNHKISIQQYFEATGTDKEKFMNDLEETIRQSLRSRLVLEKIMEVESLDDQPEPNDQENHDTDKENNSTPVRKHRKDPYAHQDFTKVIAMLVENAKIIK